MRTVLIVEDDDGIAEALEQALTVHGYGTCRTGTGAAALEQLDDASLVLLDLGLPDLAGHEVCRRIRERSCVPVIALSGRADELDRVMALHMGADDFVAKPFGRYELMARIQAVFRRTGDCPRHDGAPAAHGPLPEPGSLREPEHEHEHDPERGLERGPGAGAAGPAASCGRDRSAWTGAPARCTWTARKYASPARSSSCWPCCWRSPARSWNARTSWPGSGTRTGSGPPARSTSTWAPCAASSAATTGSRRPGASATA